MKLSDRERERYDRQRMIEGFGEKGQLKLKQARVLVAGAGGLGSPSSLYLAAAGVGYIRLVDGDVAEVSNLNRQVLHWDKDVGREKAESAAEKLRQLNPEIEVDAVVRQITEGNVLELAAGCDLIVDAMDNFPTRYLLNRAAIEKGIPFFHAGIYGASGVITTIIPRQTACLRCIFPGPPPPAKFPVIGVAPGVMGCLQAMEVIKYIVGLGELLTNRLLTFDGLSLEFREVSIRKRPGCPDCG